MTFHEKIERLTVDRKRTVVCRRAGLAESTISSCLFKKSPPLASTAMRLARVLEVELEWLVDDAQEWPPVRREGLTRPQVA